MNLPAGLARVHRRVGMVLGALLVLSPVFAATASADTFLWANKAGGASASTQSMGVAALDDGSALTTGFFDGTVTFGPRTFTSSGSYDLFVYKSTADGAIAWATKGGGSASDDGQDISPLPGGGAIITGAFTGTAIFGSTTLTSTGQNDIYVAKVNPDGTFAWATKAGGTGADYGHGISALPDGSSLVTGTFGGTATFGSTTLVSTGGSPDIVVAKVNADGTFAWATKAGGSAGLPGDDGSDISALADGSSVVTGYVSGAATFGSISLPGSGKGPFIAKVTSGGTFAWATRVVDTGGNSQGWGVSALPDGSSIVTGDFDGTATFGPFTLVGQGSWDAFVAKMNPDGTFVWVTGAGGSGFDRGKSVTVLPDGSSSVGGFFSGTASFGSTTLTSASYAAVLFRLDPAGAITSAVAPTGAGGSMGWGAAALPDGRSFITGTFDGPITFGPTSLSSAGTYDVFTAAALAAPVAPTAPTAEPGDSQATITITPLQGGSITSYTVTAGPGGRTCTVTPPATSCTITGLTNGTAYTFTVTATNAAGTSSASAPSAPVTPRANGAAPTTSLTAAVLALRVRLVSGQSTRLGIRVTNAGAAASQVQACLRMPANLIITRASGATRSARTACFTIKSIATGASATRVINARAVTTRTVRRVVTGTVSATGATRVAATPRTLLIRPRTLAPPVTG